MEKQYRILIPMSKEKLLLTLRQSTQELNIENHAYWKTILSSYCEENSILYISYAAGGPNSWGWERLKASVIDYGKYIVLEGGFEISPYVKRSIRVFLAILLIICIIISQGDIFILIEWGIIIGCPLFLAYKNLNKIGKNEERRQLIFQYIESILEGEIKAIDD